MLPAKKSRLADAVIGRLISRGLRRRFHAVYLGGAENLTRLDPAKPVVGCANHTNWWDGFVLFNLTLKRLPDHEFYIAVEERNLARYFFFPWLGAFGMGLETAADAVAGLRYAVRLLKDHPSRMAWFFVQGALTPPRETIVAKPGASFLARRADAQFLPVVLRYEWLHESKPTIFISIGEPLAGSTEPADLGARLNALNAELVARIDSPERSGFEVLHPPKLSLNKRWDYFLHLITGRRAKFERENQSRPLT